MYTCKHCKREFTAKKPKKSTSFCSPTCYHNSRKGEVSYKRTPETLERYRLANIGKLVSEEAKTNMSIAGKLAHKEGRNVTSFKKGHEVKPEWIEAGRRVNIGSKRHTTPHTEESKNKMRLKTVAHRRLQALKKEPTSIEKMLYKFLDLNNTVFEKQKPINAFIADAYIPSLNLIIEADGDYWHSTERGIATDKRKNETYKSLNYNLVRISETDFKNGKYIDILNCLLIITPNKIL